MKKILLPILFISSLGLSQDITQMNQDQIQAMMQEMQKMQICMSKIDMSSLQSLQDEAVKIEREIKQMCQQGQRDKAQKRAISYANKIINIPAIVQMKECTKNTAMSEMMNVDINDFKTTHVCDDANVEFGVPGNKRVNW